MPAVIVVSEQFQQLAKALLRARNVPDSAAVLIQGNPETFPDEVLRSVADDVLEQAVDRLTTMAKAPMRCPLILPPNMSS